MRKSYQELIDEVSALLGTPATLEGRDFGLIAFGAHTHEGDDSDLALDPVRTRSILRRRSTTEVRTWFEGFGITRVTGPVRIPPAPSEGVLHGRICLPVRHGGMAYGYIWLLDDERLNLADTRLTAAMTTAAEIGTLLAAEARVDARTGELLRQLLTADGPHPDEEAAEELRDAVGAGPLALVAVAPWHTGGSAEERASTAGLPNIVVQCVLPTTRTDAANSRNTGEASTADTAALAALVRLRTADDLGPARAAAANLLRSPYAASTTAGVSAARADITGLRAAWREARAAALAARAEERQGPVAEWAAIGPFRLLTALPREARSDPVLDTLSRPAHRQLARTAEVFLDHAGQAGRAAAALGIHRQTLYYRLSRVEQLTGLALHDGEQRLLLHMALKAARL